MRPEDTPLGRRLIARESDAEYQWRIARQHMPAWMTDQRFEELLRQVGQALTWRLWAIAIEEAARV